MESSSTSPPAPPRVISSDFLDSASPRGNLAIIVLNWKLPWITPLLLEKAVFCVCADGGANRLHDEIPAMFPSEPADSVRSRFLPHLIKGDLDSIRPDVLEFYIAKGVPIADVSHDQMSTDLQKCITYIEQHLHVQDTCTTHMQAAEEHQPKTPTTIQDQRNDTAAETHRQVDTIVAVGAHGGRLDHILSNLSTLHMFRHLDIVLCGDGNLTRLICLGKTEIHPHRAVEGPTCGLIPLLGPAVATTTGLHWNLDATKMRIGGLVSTSNLLEGNMVEVETDIDLIWTTEMRRVE